MSRKEEIKKGLLVTLGQGQIGTLRQAGRRRRASQKLGPPPPPSLPSLHTLTHFKSKRSVDDFLKTTLSLSLSTHIES